MTLTENAKKKHFISGRRVGRGSQRRELKVVRRYESPYDFDDLRCRRFCRNFAVLFFVDFAVRWRAITRTDCEPEIFLTCERVAPISYLTYPSVEY